ncbi:tyrosine-type recombinase/integrase [Methylobacterium frigidaeris]|uniref:tyrosine-type recombinase/integrase n=1 Tax=Methylobacterium frigidaeris TaxID=2038277 RepID=UPI001EDD4516|nr:tyrosine-type recombinase/integrase [Methylobacterium frigidaeris]
MQDKLLAEDALDGLNDEARRLVYLIAETGLRLSEAANLTAATIRLDDPVPHVRVRADSRRMKTEQSARDVPLVGVALLAMRAQPDGFPRYRDKAPQLSALVNKVLRGRDLLPGPGYSLYSLRHTFEDRLTAVEAPEKVMAALMGHKYHRPRYGAGPSLAQKQDWLQRIAFGSPARV